MEPINEQQESKANKIFIIALMVLSFAQIVNIIINQFN